MRRGRKEVTVKVQELKKINKKKYYRSVNVKRA